MNATTNQVKRRLKTIFATGLALVIAAAAYLYFWFIVPIGNGPAGPAISRELFAQPWTNRPVLLIGLGDSVTAGFGARKGYSYFDRLVQNPTDEFPDMNGNCLGKVFPEFAFTNLAISGSTSMELLKNELPHLAQAGSNTLGIIVVTTGGNDLIHNYGRTPPREEAMYGATLAEAKPWINDFEQRIESMIQQIESRFPGGCQIYLANIYDPTDGIGDAERAHLPEWPEMERVLDAYNDVILRCGQKHPNVHIIDIHAVFSGHGIHCTQFWRTNYDWHDPHYWYYSNLEDPNERGYDVIRRLFLLQIAKSFNQSSLPAARPRS
jgi:lysophospholipase L1-like esterase